jgi:isoamylase
LLMLHAGADPVLLTLPGEPHASSYRPTLDTDRPTGEPASPDEIPGGTKVLIPGRTLQLLRAQRQAVVTKPSSDGAASRS